MYKLIAIDGKEEFELNTDKLNHRELTVGRDNNCDIVIQRAYPSRKHARISINDDTITIEDLHSTNGTYVNNKKIDHPTTLAQGDVLRFDTAAYHLISDETEGSTVRMENLKPVNGTETEAPVVIIGGGEDTAIRTPYALPKGWSHLEHQLLFDPTLGDQFSVEAVDDLIRSNLPGRDHQDAALVVLTGNHKSRLIGLALNSKQQIWTLGRFEQRTIPLSDASISTKHACLFYNMGIWGISDEGSKNGTFVNGHAVAEQALVDGDKITLGQVELVFRIIPHESAEPV